MRSNKLSQPIDATKYDIRILWTGLKEEHVSADAGVVEGYPLDPPDAGPGWSLIDWGVESLKDADRYWTLWVREKTAAPKKKAAPHKGAAAASAPSPKKRGRPKKGAGAAPETPPVEPVEPPTN